jgi:glycine cleavage system H protein
MNIPENCRYMDTHEWIRLEGDEAHVGITDFAQGELGDVVYVELPEIETTLDAGDEAGMIDSAKTTSPILAPVTGRVIRINEKLADHPELVNQSPYEEGWLYVLEPENPKDINNLLDAAAYRKHVEEGGH